MGAIFRLEHANIMAYLTTKALVTPRFVREEVRGFLEALIDSKGIWLVEEDRGFLGKIIREEATVALKKIKHKSDDSLKEIMNISKVDRILQNLRDLFMAFPVHALAIGKDSRKKAEKIAGMALGYSVLVLIPDFNESDSAEIFDPVPAFSESVHASLHEPGVSFWIESGESVFIPVAKLDSFISELLSVLKSYGFKNNYPIEQIKYNNYYPGMLLHFGILKQFRALFTKFSRQRWTPKKVLHLSDLHHGKTDVEANVPILKAEIRRIGKSIGRVAITGDMRDKPTEKNLEAFISLRNDIGKLTGDLLPLTVVGNHDFKSLFGLFFRNYRDIAGQISPSVVVDESMKMIFICLNSSRGGRLARGKITARQMRRVGMELDNLLECKKIYKTFLLVALLHHHTLSYRYDSGARWGSIFDFNEKTITMTDAPEFLEWCHKFKINTVLHGHKHIPRHLVDTVCKDGTPIDVTTIGCGPSLGVNGHDLCYDTIEWNPRTGDRLISFYKSTGRGSFQEEVLEIKRNTR